MGQKVYRASCFHHQASACAPCLRQQLLQRQVPGHPGGISILDESLGIDWKIPTEHANLSEKDTKHQMLKDFVSPF